MSSQDDYLDELLEQMPLEEDEDEGAQEAVRPDVEAVSGMTEDEIARLLAQGTAEGSKERENQQAFGEESPAAEDVVHMLDETEDRELREIRNLLEKSDKNETIAGEGDSAGAGLGRSENPADRLLADIEEAGEREVAADVMDSKSRRTQKKEQRRAQKEEKKRAKQAAKAQKGKKAGDGGKAAAPEARTSSQESKAASGAEYDVMMDRELLDSIVSGAGRVGRHEEEEAGRSGASAAEPAENGGSIADLMSYAQADLEAATDSEADWVEQQGGSSDLDVLTVDMSEADSMLADISERPEDKEKKAGFLSKVVSFLTEEDEPEAENEDVQLSEENEEILKDLDKEGPKKAKKTKKAKKKPAKKDKKPKPKKPPKPKKQKKPKEPEAYPLGKRLTFKKALPIILFGASLGLVIFILTNLSTDYMDKQAAREAYKAGDYEACYLNLFGKKLDETEAMMYGRSESILYIRLWYREYEMLAENGAEVEALDSLIQTVKEYPDLYEYAARWNAGMDVYEVYQKMLDILSEKYGITEVEALQIAALKSDLQYTRIVTALAQGEEYGSASGQGTGSETTKDNAPDADGQDQEEELPDELPEEAEIDTGDML